VDAPVGLSDRKGLSDDENRLEHKPRARLFSVPAPEEVQVNGIGRLFVDAFNRRDVEGLVALAHPEIEFRPTMIVGSKRIYKGHEGLRCWVADLIATDAKHYARVREVRMLEDQRLVVLSEVLLDGEVVSPSAMIARLLDGKIVDVQAYLSDETMLMELNLLD
jgi:ketosteroid isomerase-like protein